MARFTYCVEAIESKMIYFKKDEMIWTDKSNYSYYSMKTKTM